MGCGGSCGGTCSCGGSCGGDCSCKTGKKEQLHRFCVTCGEEHGDKDSLFQHNKDNHTLPEPNHCPVCGTDISAEEEGGTAQRRAWLQQHLQNAGEKHRQFLQTQPF